MEAKNPPHPSFEYIPKFFHKEGGDRNYANNFEKCAGPDKTKSVNHDKENNANGDDKENDKSPSAPGITGRHGRSSGEEGSVSILVSGRDGGFPSPGQQHPSERLPASLLRNVSLQRFLQKVESSLPTLSSLSHLESLLHSLPPSLTYESYSNLVPSLPSQSSRSHIGPYITPGRFLFLAGGPLGTVSGGELFRGICEDVCRRRARCELACVAHRAGSGSDGKGGNEGAMGMVGEDGLRDYLTGVRGSLPGLRALGEDGGEKVGGGKVGGGKGGREGMGDVWVATAKARFMFFLDPRRMGKVGVERLVRSWIMGELLELGMENGDGDGEGEGDEEGDAGHQEQDRRERERERERELELGPSGLSA